MKTARTEDMNWQDIQTAIQDGYYTILIAVGSIEQHGPHLPTKTDSLIGDVLVQKITEKIDKTLQGPTIRIACSKYHLGFPGTITLQKSTFKAVIRDYVKSLSKHGFTNIIFIPSHGGNFAPLKEVIDELQNQYTSVNINGYTDLYEFVDILLEYSATEGIKPEEAGAHAGENESSLMLALANDLVIKERFAPGFVGKFGQKEGEMVFEKGIKALTQNGILGDPVKATAEKGHKYMEKLVDFLVVKVKEMI